VKLVTVVPVLNAFDVAQDSLRRMMLLAHEPEILAIDNGSSQSLAGQVKAWKLEHVEVVRNAHNVGNYAAFAQGLKLAQKREADVIAFFHSDLIIHERWWDDRVRVAFEQDPKLGLLGFIGSREIDGSGGRGLGTASNFLGLFGGGPAEVHGARLTGLMPAAVVDGCSMIFRTEALAQIGSRRDYPPHHFYDRLMSCEVLEAGWRVAVLGIGCDHLGGRTAVLVPQYHEFAEAWCREHEVSLEPDGDGWDLAVYREAERQFLREYRDGKHFIPVRVEHDWTVVHEDHAWQAVAVAS